MQLDGNLLVLLKAQKMHLKGFTAMSPCRNHNPISQDNLQALRTVRRSQVPEANQGKIRSTPPERWLYHLQSTDNVHGDLRCSPPIQLQRMIGYSSAYFQREKHWDSPLTSLGTTENDAGAQKKKTLN